MQKSLIGFLDVNRFLLEGVKDEKEKEAMEVMLQLALTGWRAGFLSNTLLCDCCQRTLGLWNFTQNNQRELHPVNEHQWFCPWTDCWKQVCVVLGSTNQKQLAVSDTTANHSSVLSALQRVMNGTL
jgi:hypothetical protein